MPPTGQQFGNASSVQCPRCRHPVPPDAATRVALIPLGGWVMRCTTVTFTCPRCGRACEHTAYKPVSGNATAGSAAARDGEWDETSIFGHTCAFGEGSIFADTDASPETDD